MMTKTMSRTKSISRRVDKFRQVVLYVKLPGLAKSAYTKYTVKISKMTQIAIVTKIRLRYESEIEMERTLMLT